MNTEPIIAQKDLRIITELLKNLNQKQFNKEIPKLSEELKRAKIVQEEKDFPADVIRINSTFSFYFEQDKKQKEEQYTLVLPSQANLTERKISIFSPLAIALLGFKEGMAVDWTLPGGQKTIRITKVDNSQIVIEQ